MPRVFLRGVSVAEWKESEGDYLLSQSSLQYSEASFLSWMAVEE